MTDRFTDEQLREWLYDAQFDHEAVGADHDFDANPLPHDTFPHYYSDDYNPTLVALFGELLESRRELEAARRSIARVRSMHFQYRAAAEDRFDCCAECNRVSNSYVPSPCATYKALTEHEGGTPT